MSLLIRCPDCQKTLKVKEELAGKKVKCPNCGTPVRVTVPQPPSIPMAQKVAPPEIAPLDEVEAVQADNASRGTGKARTDATHKSRRPIERQPELLEESYSDDHEPLPVRNVRFPASVTLAGAIWILFGLLVLLYSAALLAVVIFLPEYINPAPKVDNNSAVASAAQANAPRSQTATEMIYIVVGIKVGIIALFGFVFLFVGIQSIRGKTADTLGNGAGSVLIALLFWLYGSAQATGNFGSKSDVLLVDMIDGAVALGNGAMLFLAGLLALVGRSRYKAWRKAKKAALQHKVS